MVPSSSSPIPIRAALWAALTLASLGVCDVRAAGLLDPTFAEQGIFLSDEPGDSYIEDGLIDAEGRHVGVGWRVLDDSRPAFILRLTPSGEPDPDFGGDGDITLPLPPGFGVMELHAVSERPDGRLVVAGHVSPTPDLVDARPIVCRLLENGDFDDSFGTGGCTTPPFGPLSPREVINDMTLQANGRIVLLGTSQFAQTHRPAVMRLLSGGTRDLCFNDPTCVSGGAVISPEVGDSLGPLTGVAMAPDQKIVLSGAAVEQGGLDMVAVRLLPSGAVDNAFGDQGSRSIGFDLGDPSYHDRAKRVAVLADGSIVLAGTAEVGPDTIILAVAKLTPSGVPDIFFGQSGAGRAVTAFTDVSIDSLTEGLAIQPDGKIVVAGTSYMSPNQQHGWFGAWRLLPNGLSDPSFGTFDGRIVVPVYEGTFVRHGANAVAVDEEHVVLFGHSRDTGAAKAQATVMRLDQHGVFADGFE